MTVSGRRRKETRRQRVPAGRRRWRRNRLSRRTLLLQIPNRVAKGAAVAALGACPRGALIGSRSPPFLVIRERVERMGRVAGTVLVAILAIVTCTAINMDIVSDN